MAMDASMYVLTAMAVILLVGLLVTFLAKKVKVSHILLLIVTGVIGGEIFRALGYDVVISSTFLVSISVLTLVMIVFDGTSRFQLKMVDKISVDALKVTVLFLLFNVIILTLFGSFFVFGEVSIASVLFAALFAIIMSGTDPGSVFIMLKSKANKVIEFLEVEAIINTPFMVILPFLIIDILVSEEINLSSALAGQFIPFMQQIIVGAGAGVVVGIIVLKTMKKATSQFIGVGIITAALLGYIVAENLSGSGVLAVATMGLMFGNSYVKEKESLQEFNSMLNNSLIILVFVIIGLTVQLDYSVGIFLKALALFVLLIITRFASIGFGLRKAEFNKKEKMFIALSMPKGIAAAVVTFTLSLIVIPVAYVPMMQTLLQLIIITMIYSLILSSIIDRYSQYFIRIKIEGSK